MNSNYVFDILFMYLFSTTQNTEIDYIKYGQKIKNKLNSHILMKMTNHRRVNINYRLQHIVLYAEINWVQFAASNQI